MEAGKTEISVIIINYNTFNLTSKCLETVRDQTSGVNYEVILVDNASTETDPDLFKEKFPFIRLVKSEKNLGFAGGNNLGISHATGEYILLLNSDTELLENSIKLTWEKYKSMDNIGFMGVKTFYPNGDFQQTIGRLPSVKNAFIDLFGFHRLFPSNVNYEYPQQDFYPEYLWGCFLFFKKSLLENFKGNQLNPAFFMYHEDLLWCWEARKAGYKNYYYTGTQIIHHFRGSQKDSKVKKTMNKELVTNYKTLKVKINGILGYPVYSFLTRALASRVNMVNKMKLLLQGKPAFPEVENS